MPSSVSTLFGGRSGLLTDDGLAAARAADGDAEAAGAAYVAPQVTPADGVESPPRVVRVTAAMALTVVSVVGVVAIAAALGGGGQAKGSGSVAAAAGVAGRMLEYDPPRDAKPCNLAACDKTGVAIGTVIAWASALVYLSSRPPQILRNYRRHSVEGLSPIMFGNACMGPSRFWRGTLFQIHVDERTACLYSPAYARVLILAECSAGNLTYGIAVIMRGPAAKVKAAAPFLMGSLGVMGFDMFILGQFWWYNKKRDRKSSVTLDGVRSGSMIELGDARDGDVHSGFSKMVGGSLVGDREL